MTSSRWDGRWVDPHQRRRRGRLQADGLRRRPCPAAATWRELVAAPARPADRRRRAPTRTTWCGWSARTPSTASWSRDRDGRRARHRLRRGGLRALARAGGYEYDTTVTRFVYQSPTTPRQWFDYDMASARSAPCARPRRSPPATIRPRYETRRLYATAADGAEVPITVLMRKGTPLDGSAPLLLYGYGAYGFAHGADLLDPQPVAWSTAAGSGRSPMSAAARTRAGAGSSTGAASKKTNTFTDFIACAEHLVAEGYGTAGRDRRLRRLGRRHADGRDRQHAARPLGRDHRRGAVRRRAQHHERHHACR